MRKEDCYFVGKITRRHGLQGNVVLKLDTDLPENYQQMESIFIEINGLLVPFFIEKQSWRNADSKLLYFKNSTEAMVDQTIGKDVFLPLNTLPKLEGNAFYYHEVVDFSIENKEGENFGLIRSINDQTAQHYFILDRDGKQVVVPIIKDWILEVKREDKKIIMELPDGLLEVFTEKSVRDE